ncbi:efflux RND transporter periplasmic adaptor subunit [Aliifodinibius sp. S!AR15-10]|uniref:efflux RND transporter periplasmic adaptor subunit n=1 Tax=Aliifodinibius sp. S!AR15-10 TaxID=2950437 RepID=UPI002858903C|nr:efflux RND transporter periplasmic adaptor subunit [Aliifodinibius sp. S!AR15-10]MDR8390471.1 efflux RND transporter periplasmic adaptor subunit [Aliifodinibius sp. S!AR15-10]
MNTKHLFLFISALILVAAGGYWFGLQTGNSRSMQNTSADTSQAETSSAAQPQQEGDREILYWKAPMDPTEIYDEPGKSKMGMDLVPVYADEAQDTEGQVSINPVVVQNMNVRTAPVQRKDLSTTVRTVGKVEYDEQKLHNISTKISGWIEQLHVDYTGQMVRQGDPLFSIYSPKLVTTQREYLLALNTLDKISGSDYETVRSGSNSLLKAARKRLDYWDIPESEIERLRETGEVQKTLTLHAPASGVVTMKSAIEGEHIKAGNNVYKIADLSTVWVQTSIYDYEVPWVREGQPAEMELSYQPGNVYKGKVAYVYPEVDRKTRTVQVRLEFPNPDLNLKPGMYASVRIESRPISDAVVIPSEAVLRTGERNVVFVALGEGKFEPREVTLGVEGGPRNEELQVLSGAEPGEMVVTSAQFLIDSESRLQEAIQKMLQQKKPADTTMKDMEMEMKNMQMDMDTDTGSATDTVQKQRMKEMNRQ